jgi:hypothetical protein
LIAGPIIPGSKPLRENLERHKLLLPPKEMTIDLPGFDQVLELFEASKGSKLECLGRHLNPLEEFI